MDKTIYEVLTSQRFANWYTADLEDYLQGTEKAKSKEEILADIRKLFKLSPPTA
jgi:hypothetical protein